MRVLILGGTGLISTAIARQFLQRGVDLTLFNRGQKEARLLAGAKVIIGDRYDFPAFERQMAEAGTFDCVIDMICFTPDQAESALRAFQGRTGHFIFCSTVDVYSKPAHHYPVLENEPRRGNNSYGSNKILCEDLFGAAHQHSHFPVTIIRPAFTYGEGGSVLDYSGWSTRIIDRLRKGKPIIAHGDGSSLWSCCHIDDAARAFVAASGNSRTIGKAYHVTGEEWMTWNRYYQDMALAINAPAPTLVHIPTDLLYQIAPRRAAVLAENFSGHSIFDNTAAHTDLDFHYTIPWIEGVRRTVTWLDEHNAVENSDNDAFDDQVIAGWNQLSAAMKSTLSGIDS